MTDWNFKQLLIGVAAGRRAQRHDSRADQQHARQEGYAEGYEAGWVHGLARAHGVDIAHLEELFRRLPPLAQAEFAQAYLDVPDHIWEDYGTQIMNMVDVHGALNLVQARGEQFERTLSHAARTRR